MAHRVKHRAAALRRRQLGALAEDFKLKNLDGLNLVILDDEIVPAELIGGKRTPKRIKPALQRRASHATRPHELRGRHPSPETVASRRRANQVAKRSRKINRTRQKRRGQIVPLAWLAAAAILIGSAIGLSPQAHALTYGVSLRVEVSWVGGSCWGRTATKPADGDARILAPAFVSGCYDTASDYQFVTPGQWYGVDPDIGDAYAVSCTVTNRATGGIVLIDFATNGNGHNATCLGKWF